MVWPDGCDTVDELYPVDYFRQLVVYVESAPVLFGRPTPPPR